MDAMAEANVSAAGVSQHKTISDQCVTGFLLPTGLGEIKPHGIPNGVEYLPGFVKRQLLANSLNGFKLKLGEDGKTLPPIWRGMTFRLQGEGKNAVVAAMHAIGNVSEPMGDAPPPGQFVFWKIAENEPERYTFQIQKH
jgi:hypothetical protein